MIKINLLPPELRKKRRFVLLDRTLLYIIFATIILIFLLNFITTQQKSRITHLEEEISAIQAELVHYKHITELVSRIEAARASIESRIEEFQKLDRQRAYWIDHFSAFAGCMPELVWISKYSQDKANIVMSGISYSIQNVATLMVQLLKAKIFEKLALSFVKETSLGEHGTAYVFELKTELPSVETKKAKTAKKPGAKSKIREQLGTREEARKAAGAFK